MSFFKNRYTTTRTHNSYGDQLRIPLPALRPFPIIRDVLVFIIAFVSLAVLWPITSVPTGHRGVITVGGKITGIKDEGFMLIWPWEDLNVFNVRAEEAKVDKAEGGTSDLQVVHVNMSVRYSVVPNRVAEVFEQYSKDGNLDSYVATATQEVFKAVTARYTAPDLVAKRSQVGTEIASGLRSKLEKYGAQVINIDMTNFAFSQSYMQAINEKATEEQKKLAAQNKVLTVEAEQRAKIVTAEAEANALKAKADGEAYALLKAATAQADALRVQNAALAQNKDVLELRRIEVEMKKAEAWNGALPTAIYSGAPVPFLDVGKQYGSPTPRQ